MRMHLVLGKLNIESIPIQNNGSRLCLLVYPVNDSFRKGSMKCTRNWFMNIIVSDETIVLNEISICRSSFDVTHQQWMPRVSSSLPRGRRFLGPEARDTTNIESKHERWWKVTAMKASKDLSYCSLLAFQAPAKAISRRGWKKNLRNSYASIKTCSVTVAPVRISRAGSWRMGRSPLSIGATLIYHKEKHG